MLRILSLTLYQPEKKYALTKVKRGLENLNEDSLELKRKITIIALLFSSH